MNIVRILLIILVLFTNLPCEVSAQDSTMVSALSQDSIRKIIFTKYPQLVSLQDSLENRPFTIRYNIEADTKGMTVAESYAGGNKTIYFSNGRSRARLVSLMRIQSLFYKSQPGPSVATMVKESGVKTLYKMNAAQWKSFNSNYDSVIFQSQADTVLKDSILGFPVNTAVTGFADGSKLTVRYVPYVEHELYGKSEPLFRNLNGLPLAYTFEKNGKKLIYSAERISFDNIPDNLFTVPHSGYKIVSPKAVTVKNKTVPEEEVDE